MLLSEIGFLFFLWLHIGEEYNFYWYSSMLLSTWAKVPAVWFTVAFCTFNTPVRIVKKLHNNNLAYE